MTNSELSLVSLLFTLAVATGCAPQGEASPDARPGYDAAIPPTPTEFGGERPVTLQVPSSYSADAPTPLVIALHGFFRSPDYILPLLKLENWYEDKGFLFIAPHGLSDADGNHYWNATPACCDFYDAGPDDVGYLAGLIDDISAEYNVDPNRTFVIGHSNGAFMAQRLACEHADKIAAVISFAGASYMDSSACEPSEPIAIAHLHGTADSTINYDGGVLEQGDLTGVAYPSAPNTVANWASYNDCDETPVSDEPLDLTDAEGAETQVTRYTGCPSGIDAELWTMPDVGHIVGFNAEITDLFWRFLEAHPKSDS